MLADPRPAWDLSAMEVAHSAAPVRRVAGRRFVFGFVGLLGFAIAAGLLAFFALRVPAGPILSRSAPLPDGGWLVVREGRGDTRHVFLVRVGAGGDASWWNGLFGAVAGVPPVATGDLAIVRADSGRSMAETFAFDLASGDFRWRAPHPGASASKRGHGRLVVAGSEQLVEVWEGRPSLAVARATHDGSERWRATLPASESPWAVEMSGGIVAFRAGSARVRLVLDDGRLVSPP